MGSVSARRSRIKHQQGCMLIYNSARATSAAPGFFKPFKFDNMVFMDGGFLHNNPLDIATEEAQRIADSHRLSTTPDFLLSLGTCLSQDYKDPQSYQRQFEKFCKREEKDSMFKSGKLKTPVLTAKTILRAVQFQVKLNIDSERKWEQWNERSPPAWTSRAIRVNPDLEEEPPALYEVDKVTPLRYTVTGWLQDPDSVALIKDISCRLVASSFYFERHGHSEKERGSSIRLHGFIRCRLSHCEAYTKALGVFLGTCTTPAAFVIESCTGSSCEIEVPIRSMKEDGRFQGVEVEVLLPGKDSVTSISLKLTNVGNKRIYPLSGFPRNLMKHDFGPTYLNRSDPSNDTR